MRHVQVYILRLLVDPHDPGRLRGALQPGPASEQYAFDGEAELLACLRRLLAAVPERAQNADRPEFPHPGEEKNP